MLPFFCLCRSVVDAWSCECWPWEFNSVHREAGEQGKLYLRGQLRWTGEGWSASTPRTELEMGLPSEMPAQVCVAVGRSMRLCARLCQCVNAWICLSVSPSAWCMSTMPCCFLRPPSLLLVNLCPNPAAPNVHPTRQPILSSFTTLTHLFIYESLLFSSLLSPFIFNLFMAFTEVFECPYATSCLLFCQGKCGSL